MKILEIGIDNGVRHTRYYTLNKDVHDGRGNDIFFEGAYVDEKRVLPLKEAKIWAKAHGYTQLDVVRLTKGRDKTYIL